MRLASLLIFACGACAQTGWIALFDGKSTAGWRSPVSTEFPGYCWTIEDGAFLTKRGEGRTADLWTERTFQNFELEFEFKVAPGANGGIKYLVQRGLTMRWRDRTPVEVEANAPSEPGSRLQEGTYGLEYQILDDASTEEGKNAKTRTGALYQLVGVSDPPEMQVGVFHRGRIVVRGDDVEHFLNGRRVMHMTFGSPEMEAAWDAAPGRVRRLRALAKREGPIVLTHHGSQVWYRSVRIRELD